MCVERAESLSTAFSHAVLAMARNRDSPMSWVALALCMTTMHLDHSLIVDALEFDLVDMAVKCIMEETNSDVLVLLEYSSVDGANISVKLEDPSGAVVWAVDDTREGTHGFTTKTVGDYKVCFSKADPSTGAGTHKVKLDWKTGVAATDWDNIAKREKVDAMAMSLRELEAEIKEIHEGMLYLRMREEQMRDLNEATNSRVAWLSVLSLGICIGMSMWQLFYLKRFFMRKKLL